MKALSVLLVDPEVNIRNLVKSAVKALPELGETIMVSKITEAASELNRGNSPKDLLFISHRVDEAQVAPFMNSLLRDPQYKETGFINVVSTGANNSNIIAQILAKGFHGMLCEPFSTQGLKESIDITVKVKTGSKKDRLKAAVGMIIPQMIAQAREKELLGLESLNTPEANKLKSTCLSLKDILEYSGESYEGIINEIFGSFDEAGSANYGGASRRLADKFQMEKSMRDTLRRELLAI